MCNINSYAYVVIMYFINLICFFSDVESQGKAVWISESPDLSECRSVWLNSLETRVKEGESLLSISNDLSQVFITSIILSPLISFHSVSLTPFTIV